MMDEGMTGGPKGGEGGGGWRGGSVSWMDGELGIGWE